MKLFSIQVESSTRVGDIDQRQQHRRESGADGGADNGEWYRDGDRRHHSERENLQRHEISADAIARDGERREQADGDGEKRGDDRDHRRGNDGAPGRALRPADQIDIVEKDVVVIVERRIGSNPDRRIGGIFHPRHEGFREQPQNRKQGKHQRRGEAQAVERRQAPRLVQHDFDDASMAGEDKGVARRLI